MWFVPFVYIVYFIWHFVMLGKRIKSDSLKEGNQLLYYPIVLNALFRIQPTLDFQQIFQNNLIDNYFKKQCPETVAIIFSSVLPI